MKKIFTSISMALCLAASSFNASAQQATQLSDAQKQEIQQKVLPVVFEQIKEQAGIDILGWAQPKLTADYLGSLPGFSGLKSDNGLRAATNVSVQPDSIVINQSALALIDPAIGALMGNMKISFGEDFLDVNVPLNGQTVTVKMPTTISVTTTSSVPKLQHIVDIMIESRSTEGLLLDLNMEMLLWGETDPENAMQLLQLTLDSNEALTEYKFDVIIGDGLKDLGSMLGSYLQLPEGIFDMNYEITADISSVLAGTISLSLAGIVQNEGVSTPVSMGDAIVAVDLNAILSQTGWPIQYIDITSYEAGIAYDWSRLVFDMSQANAQDLVLTINNIGYANADKENATVRSIINITMTDNTVNVTNPQSAAQAVIQNVVSQLANEGKVAPYAMAIEMIAVDTNGDGIINGNDNVVPVMDVTVTPSLSATGASATINIKSYSGESTTEVDLIATATTEKVQLDVEMGVSVIGSAYFTSNILEATSNEDIQLANVEVTPVKDGIYVSGTTAATYSIISMSGATVANGTVSGDNAYISTSALAKGIYVIVVTENGESKAIKFAR